MNKQQQLRKTLDFLAFKDMDEMDFTITSAYDGVNLSVEHDKITEAQLRVLKRHFGPFSITNDYGAKGLAGVVKLDEFQIKLKVLRAYTCTELDVEELTEAKWDEIREHARNGRIKLQDCAAVASMPELEPTLEPTPDDCPF